MNRPHPIENVVVKIHDLRRPLMRLFMRDGELCPDERDVLEMLEATHSDAAETHARKRFADYIERGGDATRYGQELAESVGLGIVSLKEVRRGKTIIAFPTHSNDAS